MHNQAQQQTEFYPTPRVGVCVCVDTLSRERVTISTARNHRPSSLCLVTAAFSQNFLWGKTNARDATHLMFDVALFMTFPSACVVARGFVCSCGQLKCSPERRGGKHAAHKCDQKLFIPPGKDEQPNHHQPTQKQKQWWQLRGSVARVAGCQTEKAKSNQVLRTRKVLKGGNGGVWGKRADVL